MEWNYFEPVFECDAYNRDMLKYAPWSGHRNLGYDLIANLEPETVVELGSFYGCSAFAMGQAIKDKTLHTVLWAIDFWGGIDVYTEDSYKEDIYGAFKNIRDQVYDERYLKMLKMTFDEAADRFEDQSIDILHIDGSHLYEDVKHDYELWKSKVKTDGVILFHDVGKDIVNGSIMGSHIFWEELKLENPRTLEFPFSCGLGIWCQSEKAFAYFNNLDVARYQEQCNLEDAKLKDELNKYSFMIRDKDYHIESLKEQIEIKDWHLAKYQEDMQEKDAYIETLEGSSLSQQQLIKDAYEKTIAGKDAYIKELEGNLEELRNKVTMMGVE